jgi:hypothetical protein
LYLNKIREVQPKGPYFFGGSCLDAVVTFEMARQIIEAGDYVGLLVLFDPIDVGFCRNRFPEVDRWLYRLHRQVLKTAYRIKRLDQVPRQCMLPFLYQRLKTGLRLVGYRLWRLSHRFIRVFGVSFPAMKQLQFAATVAAVGEYEPQPLSVPTVVLRPGDWPAGLFEDANKRWKSLAGNHFQVHTAAFDAADLRPPDNIQSLGFVLGVCLSSAQAATANHTRS